MTIEEFIRKHSLQSPGRSLVRPVAYPARLTQDYSSSELANSLFFTNPDRSIWVAMLDGRFSLVSPKNEYFAGRTETDYASLDGDQHLR